MIDIGVASPSAHGQAMISTATAFDQGVGQSRLGTDSDPCDERDDRDQHDGRDEPAGDHVGQPLNRRAAALGFADHADDLRQQRVRADPLGPHDEARRCR